MLLAGEAGIGKSRLVEVLRERAGSPTDHVLRCSPHHSAPCSTRCSGSSSACPGSSASSHASASSTRSNAGPQTRRLPPTRARDCSPGCSRSPIPTKTIPNVVLPLEARNMLLRMLERLLVPADGARPLLLVVEDLHWADPTTIELLDRIVYAIEGRPVATVFTYRTEFRPPWAGRDDAEEIQLGPLSEADVRELLEAAGHNLDELGLARLQATAEGVPLFVEEMAKHLEGATGARRLRSRPADAQRAARRTPGPPARARRRDRCRGRARPRVRGGPR